MAKKQKLEPEVIVSKKAIIVDTKPQFKEVVVPNGKVVYETVDEKGNKVTGWNTLAGVKEMEKWSIAQGRPFSYDEKKNQ